MNGIRNSSFARIDGTSWYALKISPSSRPSDSTMYWYACVWIASSNAWRNRYWRHSGAVMWRYVPSTMLLAASESAVTKKPRLRFTMSRSSSVNPLGSFHRAMSRFMFTSCGIQWLAQPAMYFSQAHLYLKGTSWFTSVRALMTRLSSARTRVWPIGAEGDWGGADLAGSSAGEVRPDGVEWIVCRATLSAAIGGWSLKLRTLNRLPGLSCCERHFLCLLVFLDPF